MSEHAARAYGPGLPPEGAPASARWVGDLLVVTCGDASWELPATSLQLRAGGFNDEELLLSWNVGDGDRTLIPAAATRTQFVAEAPPQLAPSLGRWRGAQQQRSRRLVFGLGVFGAILSLPLIAALLFYLNADRIAGAVVQRIPQGTETTLGELAFASMKPTMRLLESGPAYEAVKKIGTQLTAGSSRQYRWYVADDDTVNAFALPGGIVVVNTGLLREASGPAEVAGVLGHEVQHVERRHGLRGMVASNGLRALLAMVFGDVGGRLSEAAGDLAHLQYGRELEAEADREAVIALRRAGLSPTGLLQFFERMAAKESVSVAILSTHPAPADRREALRALLEPSDAQLPAPDVDWDAVQASVARAP